MTETTLNSGTYCLIDVPEFIDNFWWLDKRGNAFVLGDYDKYSPIAIPEGNWKIIGKANELTEERWKKIVDHHPNLWYKNYNPGIEVYEKGWTANWGMITATESGLSWLTSLNKKPETTLIIKKMNP